jgi:hypothetical protein
MLPLTGCLVPAGTSVTQCPLSWRSLQTYALSEYQQTLICCHSTAALSFSQVAWCLLLLVSLSVPGGTSIASSCRP